MAIPPTGEAKPPAPALVRAVEDLAPGDAVDIACGAGRHAIWLVEHGWQVTALDRDRDGIAQIRLTHPGIDARVFDLEREPLILPPASCDLVVCWLYFQRDLYPVLREAVRPGGMVALSALLQGRFAAAPGELRSYFADWTVVHEAERAHGPEKRASELIIRRPGGLDTAGLRS